MKRLLMLSVLLLTVACTKTAPSQPVDSAAAMLKMDIVETAASNKDFSTLVAAIQAADLTAALKGPGPFTVFAPTDAAFAKLPPGTVEGLLADKAKLAAILQYHVVSGSVMAADVAGLTSANTLLGKTVAIDTANGVKVNNANVIATDIATSNGVIHVIDTVLLPQ